MSGGGPRVARRLRALARPSPRPPAGFLRAPEALRRARANVQRGRLQRSLSAATALSALPLGLEIYFEHFRGSFGDKWMWTPVVLSPLLSAAGLAGLRSERAAQTLLPAVSALYCADGVALGIRRVLPERPDRHLHPRTGGAKAPGWIP